MPARAVRYSGRGHLPRSVYVKADRSHMDGALRGVEHSVSVCWIPKLQQYVPSLGDLIGCF
jgi:hypothetical protein